MEKISKVKSVQGAGTWDSNYGTLYSFEYEFEDGVVLKANHKTDSPFNPGDEVAYQVTKENEYGKIGKVGKPQEQTNGHKPKSMTKGNNASFALSYAKDLAVAHITGGRDFTSKEILAVADEFNNWLNTH